MATSEEIEAELKPIGEAAVKRLRREQGMERPHREIYNVTSDLYNLIEDDVIVGTVSGRNRATQFAASDLMLEALKAHKAYYDHYSKCNYCDEHDQCDEYYSLTVEARKVTEKAIDAAEGKERLNAGR